jgi:transcriptional regulator with XRE-family HTH domain
MARFRPVTFGQRLRRARRRVGLSQVQLAQRVGCHHTTISYYERDAARPALHRLPALAQGLGLTLRTVRDWLEDAQVRLRQGASGNPQIP